MNKTTLAVKQVFEEAFNQLGGVRALVAWAREKKNKGEFFKLYARLIPQDVNAKHSGSITMEDFTAASRVGDSGGVSRIPGYGSVKSNGNHV